MKLSTLLLAGLLLCSCGRAIGTVQDSPEFTGDPAAHAFIFEVTHELDRDGGWVDWELTNSNYVPSAEHIRYWVSFSPDGGEIEISPIVDDDEYLFRGSLHSSQADRWEYRLTDGAFAGGHFHAWREDERLRAELTMYGSGLPVVASFRGVLIPVTE